MGNNSKGGVSIIRSPSAAFHLVAALLLCFITWKISENFISLDNIPWGLVAVFFVPLANSIALYHKLSETRKNVAEDLSRQEARELSVLVRRKRSYTLFIMILQLFITLSVIIVSVAGKQEVISAHIQVITNFVLSSVAGCLYFIIPMLLGIKEVNDFEALIKTRKKESAKQVVALKKLARK